VADGGLTSVHGVVASVLKTNNAAIPITIIEGLRGKYCLHYLLHRGCCLLLGSYGRRLAGNRSDHLHRRGFSVADGNLTSVDKVEANYIFGGNNTILV
jgi:hypothetical protein